MLNILQQFYIISKSNDYNTSFLKKGEAMTKSTSKKTKEIWGKRIPAQEQNGFSKKGWLLENNLHL